MVGEFKNIVPSNRIQGSLDIELEEKGFFSFLWSHLA
jgi:hypothetical protein